MLNCVCITILAAIMLKLATLEEGKVLCPLDAQFTQVVCFAITAFRRLSEI